MTDHLIPLLLAVGPAAAVAALRMSDVILSVCRTVMVVAGRRPAAALLAAAEATTWLLAADVVLSDLTPIKMAGYAIGVGTGTWVGMALVHRLRLGTVQVRIFVPADDNGASARTVANAVRDCGLGATLFPFAEGRDGPQAMILSIVRRREVARACDAARGAGPEVFIAVDSTAGPGSAIGGKVARH